MNLATLFAASTVDTSGAVGVLFVVVLVLLAIALFIYIVRR